MDGLVSSRLVSSHLVCISPCKRVQVRVTDREGDDVQAIGFRAWTGSAWIFTITTYLPTVHPSYLLTYSANCISRLK